MSARSRKHLFIQAAALLGASLAATLAGCALPSSNSGDNLSGDGAVTPGGQGAGPVDGASSTDGGGGSAMDAASTVDLSTPAREAGASDANLPSDANIAFTNEAARTDAADAAAPASTTGLDGGHGPVADSGAREEASASSIDSSAVADESVWLGPMNLARASVNEAPLVWDPIAAQVALNYAKQCNYMHNPNASADYNALGGKSRLGEDIAAGAPTQSIAGAITSWVGEVADYDHATNTCATGKVCGHYTQIVWSTTTGVGCAQVSCTGNSPFGSFASGKWQFEVCDFSPAGNIIGKSPY